MALIGKKNIEKASLDIFGTPEDPKNVNFNDIKPGDIIRVAEGVGTLVYIYMDKKSLKDVGWFEEEHNCFVRATNDDTVSVLSAIGYKDTWPKYSHHKNMFKVSKVWRKTTINPNNFKSEHDFVKFYKNNNLENLGEK